MKKLFSDDIVSKIRKIPSPVWVIFVIISFFFANAYEFLLQSEQAAFMVDEIYEQFDISYNLITIGVIVSIFHGLLLTLVAEAVIAILYNIVIGRYRAQINKSDFKFRIRYLIIIINLIIGVLSIGYFFTQKTNGSYGSVATFFKDQSNVGSMNPYYSIQSSVLPFLVIALAVLAFFEDFRKRYVSPRMQAPLFNMFYKIFIGVYGIVFVIDIVTNFLLYSDISYYPYVIVSYCLEFISIIGMGVLYYFAYKKIKKESENHIDINETKTNTNIFNDFGF